MEKWKSGNDGNMINKVMEGFCTWHPNVDLLGLEHLLKYFCTKYGDLTLRNSGISPPMLGEIMRWASNESNGVKLCHTANGMFEGIYSAFTGFVWMITICVYIYTDVWLFFVFNRLIFWSPESDKRDMDYSLNDSHQAASYCTYCVPTYLHTYMHTYIHT